MVNWAAAKRVLIIRFLGIGDVLFTTPMIRALKKKYPHLQVTYLTSSVCEPVLQRNPYINEIVTFNMPSLKELKNKAWPLLKLLYRLRRGHYDITINTHRSFNAILFGYFIGSSTRIGFDYKRWGGLLTDKKLLVENKYSPAHYMDLLHDCCEEQDGLKLEIYPSSEDQVYANAALAGCENVIAIAPGGGNSAWMDMSSKRWTTEGYAEVILSLIKNNDFVLLGGKYDVAIACTIKDIVSSPVVDLTGKTSLSQAAALLQKCKLFIGNDSALLHIAAAAGIPTVSIFGPTNPMFFAPRGMDHVAVKSKIKCSPCFDYGKLPECPESICMKSIEPKDVIIAISRLLARQSK